MNRFLSPRGTDSGFTTPSPKVGPPGSPRRESRDASTRPSPYSIAGRVYPPRRIEQLANISIYAIGPNSTVGDLRYGQEE